MDIAAWYYKDTVTGKVVGYIEDRNEVSGNNLYKNFDPPKGFEPENGKYIKKDYKTSPPGPRVIYTCFDKTITSPDLFIHGAATNPDVTLPITKIGTVQSSDNSTAFTVQNCTTITEKSIKLSFANLNRNS
jgi:hypothetical protein